MFRLIINYTSRNQSSPRYACNLRNSLELWKFQMAHISRAIGHASVGIFTSASVLISAIALSTLLVPHLPSFFLCKNHKDSRLRSHLTLVMKLRGFCSVQFKDITDLNNYHKSSSNYTWHWHKQELSIRITVWWEILLHSRFKLELGKKRSFCIFLRELYDIVSSMSMSQAFTFPLESVSG